MGTKDYKSGAADIVNFRILPDGSLQKRSGYTKLCSLPSKIRAIWSGKLNQTTPCFVLAGGDVYHLDYDCGEYTKIASIGNSQKVANFFYYQLSLFLIDGNEIYRVTTNEVRPAVGYAPLIGKDWHENEIGEINEPRNALTNRARISYLITKSATATLYTDGAIDSIDAVYVNGERVPEDRYMLSSVTGGVIVRDLMQNDRVELYFRYASSYSSSSIKANTKASVFGGINNTRPFLYGGGNGTVMYSGGYVSERSLTDCRRVYSDSDAIYFPIGYEFTVGDGRYPIRAVGRHFDRLLIFTEGGVWMADSSACGIEDFPLMSINTSVPTISSGSIATIGNSPCTVGIDGVYSYSSNTDELDECNAYSISSSIKPMLAQWDLAASNLYYDKSKDELLLYSYEEDTVWVYSPTLSVWTRFTGICAHKFFELEETTAFYNGRNVFVFYDELVEDEESREIQASVTSHPEDFATPNKKSFSYATAEVADGEISVEIYSENESILRDTLTFSSELSQPVLQKKRVRANRFKDATVSLCAGGQTRPKIFSAHLATK